MLARWFLFFFFFSSRRRHTRFDCDWSSDVCSSDLGGSVELRYDTRIDQYFVQTVEPYIFYDAAKIWNRLGGNGSGLALHSTGAGVRVGLEHGISAGVEYARTLTAVPGSDNGSLKSKVLFNAAVRF